MAENQIDLKFVTDSTQLEKATRVAERLEKRITNLVNQEAKGRISTDQYSAAISSLASEMQRAAGNNIKARNEVFSYSRAVYQASKATEELSSDLTATAQSFNNVSKSSGNAAAKVNQFGENIKFSGRNVNRFGAYAQQAGYQVGDFAVQVQSGTSWLTALGQQGAQLLGIFGPAGAIAGAALAITTAIVNPLIAAFNAAENLNEELDKSLEKLQEQNRLRGLGGEETTAQIAELTAQLIKQESQISRMEQGVRARTRGREGTTYAEELQRNLEITKQNNKELYEQRDITAARLRILMAQRDAQKALVGDQAQEAENLRQNEELDRGRLSVVEEQRRKREEYVAQMGNFFREQTARINAEREKQAAAERAALAREAQDRIDSMSQWNAYRTRSNDKYYADEQKKAKAVADKLAEEQAASVEAMKISIDQYMDVYDAGVAEMIRQHAELNDLASELGERLGISFATAVGIIRQAKAEATVGLDAFGGAGDFKYSYRSTFKPPKDKKGGGFDPLQGQLEQLQKFLATEQELLLMEYETRQETLEQSLEKEYITRQQYNEMFSELERKKAQDIAAIESTANAQRLGDMSSFFGAAASVAAAGGDRMTKVVAAFQGAQAVISAYSAYAQVLADPSFIGRPWARFAAGAKVLAAGLGAVRAIKGAGSSGSASGAAAAVPATASVEPQRVIVEGLDRNSLYTGEQLSNIFEALYKENKDRGFVFEVAR